MDKPKVYSAKLSSLRSLYSYVQPQETRPRLPNEETKYFYAATNLHVTDVDEKLEKQADVTTGEFFCHTDPRAPSFFVKIKFIKCQKSSGGQCDTIELFLVQQSHRPDISIKMVTITIDDGDDTPLAFWRQTFDANEQEIYMGDYTYEHFIDLTSPYQRKPVIASLEIAYQRFDLEEKPTEYTLCKDLKDLLDKQPEDVVFVLGGKTSHQDPDQDPDQDQGPVVEILAHKAVLERGCEYFANMFSLNWKESSQDKIELKDVEPEDFRALLDYLYGKLSADRLKKYAVSLCILADKYGLTDLKEMCERNVAINLDHTNVVDALLLTNTILTDPILFSHARAIFRNYVSKISSEDFEKLSCYPHLVSTIFQASNV